MQDILRHVVSEEGNVRLVQAKIELGEADAAIVYRTEARRSERVRIVEIPPPLNVRATYQIGHAPASVRLQRARDFVRHVLSEQGRAAFLRAGFSYEGGR
jgi:molybdate transport system substrate-binding protein